MEAEYTLVLASRDGEKTYVVTTGAWEDLEDDYQNYLWIVLNCPTCEAWMIRSEEDENDDSEIPNPFCGGKILIVPADTPQEACHEN